MQDQRVPLTRRLRNRNASAQQKTAFLTGRLSTAAKNTNSAVYVPTDPRALEAAVQAARATGGFVLRTPRMESAGSVDLIDRAPHAPETSSPVGGLGEYHTSGDTRDPYKPEPHRHRGRKVVLCYRRSEINPGRYLEAAIRRAGIDARVETEGIDLSTVDRDSDAVVFVEGPYPALKVTGQTQVPTLFWAHHGEHHLSANLRLTDRYRADAVLLAHSWHLALWFPAPVHRFPFGFDPTLLDPKRLLGERRFDVAMVGAGLTSGGQYGRRQQLVADLSEALPGERLGFRESVSSEEMARLYADARIVINEGGTRHFPITMRVLEAVGSGAILLSDLLPGMDCLLQPETDFVELGSDVVTKVRAILDEPAAAQSIADSALERARGRHTYDHRVDELLEIAAATPKRSIANRPPTDPLASVIENDVEVQRVAQWKIPELAEQLPDREVWDAETMDRSRLAPTRMEAVAISTSAVSELDWLLSAARRYAYVQGNPEGLADVLASESRQVTSTFSRDITRIDFHAPSYRIMDFEETPS